MKYKIWFFHLGDQNVDDVLNCCQRIKKTKSPFILQRFIEKYNLSMNAQNVGRQPKVVACTKTLLFYSALCENSFRNSSQVSYQRKESETKSAPSASKS